MEAWLDLEKLLPGQNWQHAIREALQTCTHFIALLSHASVNKRGFVQKELKRAFDLLEEFPPGQIFLIPVRLEAVDVQYHQLHDIQRVDLFENRPEALRKILQAINAPRVQPNRRVPVSRLRAARRVALAHDRRTAVWVTAIGVNDLVPEYPELAKQLARAAIEPSYRFSTRGTAAPPPKYRVVVAGSGVSLTTIRHVCEAVATVGEWYFQLWHEGIRDNVISIGAYGYGGSPAARIDEALLRHLERRSFTRSKLRKWIERHGSTLDADYPPKEE